MGYGQYRYWRIRFVTTQGAPSPRIARIQFKNAPSGVDWTIQNWGVSDTGYQDTNSNNAADSSTATNWITGQSTITNAWVGARIYGGPAQIQEIVITATNDANFAGAPSAFWVEGSNDTDGALPTNWVRLAYCAAATWTIGSSQTFDFYAVQPTDTARITRVSAETAYSAARTLLLSSVNAEALQKPSGTNLRLSTVKAMVLLSNANANASGQLLTDTASIVAGAATGGSSTPGQTLADTVSIIDGSASGTVGRIDASASGGTVTDAASVVAGTPSVSVSANGGTFTDAASILGGNATGQANVNGDLISVAPSVVAGAATGQANVSGVLIASVISVLPGDVSASETLNGAIITGTVSVIAGIAVGGIEAPGGTVSASASIIPGTASVSVLIPAATLVAAASIIPGVPNVSSATPTRVITATFGAIAGIASGGATSNGDLLEIVATVADVGAASGGGHAPGWTLNTEVSFFAGGLSVSSEATGDLIDVAVSFIPGIGLFLIGYYGDVMFVSHEARDMTVLSELRAMSVPLEGRNLTVPLDHDKASVPPRIKGVVT